MAQSDKKPMDAAARKKLLGDLVSGITKQFGEGAIIMLGDQSVADLECWPTGSLNLDLMIGPGGIPRGRVIELYGTEGGGKTTLTLSIVAEVQKRGGICAFVDAEHALDLPYARRIGVDVDELLFNQPEYGEQGLAIAQTLIESGSVSLVVVDSVAALTPKAELEGELEDANMALQARMMGKSMRRLKAAAKMNNCTVIFINQLREKPGMNFGGNPEYTPGGKALKYFADIRLELRPGEPIKQGDARIGNNIKAKAVKNKVAPPYRTAIFKIIFGEGIDALGEIIDNGVKLGIIEKAGSWYAHGGQRIGQGEDKVKAWLKENVAARDQIEAAIRDPKKAQPAPPAAPPKAEGEKP